MAETEKTPTTKKPEAAPVVHPYDPDTGRFLDGPHPEEPEPEPEAEKPEPAKDAEQK